MEKTDDLTDVHNCLWQFPRLATKYSQTAVSEYCLVKLSGRKSFGKKWFTGNRAKLLPWAHGETKLFQGFVKFVCSCSWTREVRSILAGILGVKFPFYLETKVPEFGGRFMNRSNMSRIHVAWGPAFCFQSLVMFFIKLWWISSELLKLKKYI